MTTITNLACYKNPKLDEKWSELVRELATDDQLTIKQLDEGSQKPAQKQPNQATIRNQRAKGLEWITNTLKDKFALTLSELREEGYCNLIVEREAYDRYGKPISGRFAIYGKKEKS